MRHFFKIKVPLFLRARKKNKRKEKLFFQPHQSSRKTTYTADVLSPVHLDLENDLIQSLYFFSKMQKVLADPVVVNFFWNVLDPTLSFKKNTSVGWSSRCNFIWKWKNFHLKKNTCVGFKYNDWIKSFSKSKWTGL